MRAATLFSGIGAPEVAMPGWQWLWHAEIEAFPAAVMAERHPGSINLGDVTAPDFVERALDAGRPDIVVFGSPCQSFSVAGKRLGLADPRGDLALTALGLVRRLRPRWICFENVPGLLSSDKGRDFGAFLSAVAECRYLGCWRVLDAQFTGVPQRRRRIFFVGYLGDWRPAAAVLSLLEGMSGHPAAGDEARERVADSLTVGANQYSGFNGEPVAHTLNAKGGSRRIDGESETFVTHSLRADGFDASNACTVANCDKKRHANGLCKPHYARAKRHGDPLAGRVSEGEPMAFLLAHVDHQDDQCVAWPYAKLTTGYGSVSVNGKTARAHRHMCELTYGPPPSDAMDAAHSCGNRACINPKHLRWANRADNMADTLEHGTTARGERHGAHKLTESSVIEIRQRLQQGETHESIAEAFGVGRNTITDIAKGKNWAWLDGTGRGTPLVPVAFNWQSGGDCRGLEPAPVTMALQREQVPAIAFSCKDSGLDAGGIAPTLRAMPHDGSHANAGGQVAVVTLANKYKNTVNSANNLELADADATQGGPGEILRDVFSAVGAEAFCEWGLGVLSSFPAAEVLQRGVLQQVPDQGEIGGTVERGAHDVTQPSSAGSMREVWEAGCARRPSQEWRLAGRIAEQLGAYLSELPQQGAPPACLMHDLRRAGEGARLLQQALDALEEARRSDGVQGAAEADVLSVRGAGAQQGSVREALHAGKAPATQVRRLSVIECARLQGFPDLHAHIITKRWRKIDEDEARYLASHGLPVEQRDGQWVSNVPADGPMYKAYGNSMAVPCIRWILERIEQVDAAMLPERAAA